MAELFLLLVRGSKHRRRATPQNGYRGELVGLLGCYYFFYFCYHHRPERLRRHT